VLWERWNACGGRYDRRAALRRGQDAYCGIQPLTHTPDLIAFVCIFTRLVRWCVGHVVRVSMP